MIKSYFRGFLYVAVICLLGAMTPMTASAQERAVITFSTLTLSVGETGVFEARVDCGSAFCGAFTIQIAYDSDLLQVEHVELGDYLGSDAIAVENNHDQPGEIRLSAIALGNPQSANKDEVLFTITVKALEPGQTQLVFTRLDIGEQGSILASSRGGLVRIQASESVPSSTPSMPAPTLTPKRTETPTPAPTAVTCPGALPSRLVPGGMGEVTPGEPNNLRAAPSVGAERIGRVPPGDPFRILDGPECRDGYAWWQINYDGTVGWTVEGDENSYWLAPYDVSGTSSVSAASNASDTCGGSVAQQFQAVWSRVEDTLGCPGDLTNTTLFSYQDFEHGKLIWRGFELDGYNVVPSTEATALVLYDDNTWRLVQFEKFGADDPVYFCPELGSPSSPLTPVRGFGKLLCIMPDIRERLGDPTDAEQGYPTSFVQQFEHGFLVHYHRGNDTWRTLAFFNGANVRSGTWRSF